MLRHGGRRNKHLGTFATAEEAALAVARFLGPEGVAAALAPPAGASRSPMTAAEAHAAAAEEGLALLRADNAAGFKHVTRKSASKPFQARPEPRRAQHYLGHFATAEEAALAVARFLGPLAAAPRRPMTRPQAPRRERRRRLRAAEQARQAASRPTTTTEEYVVKAEAVSDDDDGPPTPPTPAPVLCYCERPAALLDGRWVCAQLVEGDFCILGRARTSREAEKPARLRMSKER